MLVKGRRPTLALVIEVEEVFFHSSKPFLRSELWNPDTWEPTLAPPRAVIAKTLERPGDSPDELERYYRDRYGDQLYGNQ